MLLTKLTLSNFGPYRGENSFNLRTTPEEPIVLIGGKNGAGKTTFFESIQICVHGQSALGQRTSQREYEAAIREYMYSDGESSRDEAAVKLQFEYSNLGERDTYTVERQWRDRGKSIEETVHVSRNGEPLDDLEEDQWEDFLKELIPPGLSQLFFFDGEQVQQLADAIEEDDGFEESMLSLLGLDLVERLEADLSIYLSRKLDEEGTSELAEEIESLQEQKADTETELADVQTEIAEMRDDIRDLDKRIAEKEDELSREGGAFAEQRNEKIQKRDRLEEEIERIEEEIRELAQGVYPFALVPDLADAAVERLAQQREAQTQQRARTEVMSELDALAADETADGDPETHDRVVSQLRDRLTDRLGDGDSETEFVDRFSEQEQRQIERVIEEATTAVPEKLQARTAELEEKTRALNAAEQQISRAPEQEVLSPILAEINEATEQRGKLKNQLETLEEREDDLEMELSQLDAKIERTIEKQQEHEDVSERADLASRTRGAVQDYKEKITTKKLERLEEVLTDRYRSLSNKSEHYQQVHIDTDDLTITIETADGGSKTQSQLSAGERQIFATALLWALADISGRPLPFLIDTPLGRLDQEHRNHFVEEFLPNAAHQVIVLSTDTEITDRYRDPLESAVSAAYHLDYQDDGGYTRIDSGYFDGALDEMIETPTEESTQTDQPEQSTGKTQINLGGASDE